MSIRSVIHISDEGDEVVREVTLGKDKHNTIWKGDEASPVALNMADVKESYFAQKNSKGHTYFFDSRAETINVDYTRCDWLNRAFDIHSW